MAKQTIEQLREQLAEAEAEQKKELLAKRKEYETSREELVSDLASDAYKIAVQLVDLKTESINRLNEFRQAMMEYGELRGGRKNKGSFEIKNDNWKITFTTNIVKKFDERAYIAEKHINEFLKSFLKKKDVKIHEMVSNLLKRDEESGQFDIDMISRLYSMEDSFNDPNWVKGIELFKQSYVPYNTAQYVRFYQLNEVTNAYDNLLLDFAKVKPLEPKESVEA